MRHVGAKIKPVVEARSSSHQCGGIPLKVSGSSRQCGGIPLELLCLFSSVLVNHKNFSRQSVI